MTKLQHIINGAKVNGTSDSIFEIYNPSTGKIVTKMQGAGSEDVKKAIDAAHDAFEGWKKVSPSMRAQIMFNYRDLLNKNLYELAELISREHGKTLADAKGEVLRGLEVVEFCTSINSHLKSDFTADVSSSIDSYNLRQPLGVCAGITPFNFPAMVPMWMYPVAIACGNTFVLKLSERDPSCGLRLTELMAEAGLPDGVLNTVVGDKEAVDEILHNPKVAAVSFVGSTSVGEYIYQEGCSNNKRVQALCGAKNHMIVMPDASLDQSCEAILGAAYGSAGERCMAISVVVAVGNEIADRIVEQLTPMVKSLKIGAFDEDGVEMGPVITKQSQENINNYINQGIDQGAKLVLDGRDNIPKEGFYVGACIFDKVTKDMSIYTDEIFGPVLSIVRVENYEEALDLVNKHEYGNGAAIFTRDGDTARHFTMNVEAGMAGVNVPIPVPVAMHSFGGWKRSLFGSSSIHGMEGVRFYTKLKTITSRWPSGIRKGAQFHFEGGKNAS
ncbi:MAG TPA: methylmalonate-semialdehyde dehydrogenase (CoA acylating) [Gammaproteobacteria bacterium]|nr:CoA-acylating methylmalonate-semialdehyde dehydrogenase [Gammaproteobacteria bacterium]HAY40981.1 methylmalonate-semialdehyde dehydrogenase (CoA acylating) [Gammaproteobacteria bacterium]|tara:strand:- start:4798 stop:6294 length:1497 start_codon:yes stop_codon:yes gene_type:complete